MKETIKRLGITLLIVTFCIVLTGCGDKNKDDSIIDNFENDNKQNTGNSNENDTSSNEIKLYSDDTKIVFNMNNVYYIVYYHDGTDITGLQYVYNYPDTASSKQAEILLKATYDGNDNVEKFERQGKQLIVTFKEDEYRGETLESVKQTYSYLTELYNN